MSMLPCGHPEPPETTLLILNESGAWYVGAAIETAARRRVVSVYFIVGYFDLGEVGENKCQELL